MKYSINLWSDKGQDQFLAVDVDSDDRAFNIAKEQWNNDLSAITIERSFEEDGRARKAPR